ncbi:MAG: hypothetical protein M3121_04245 [Chloroflexota bacterium]|nr:hypothetical protein [Chloroflexota bacterium]
MGEAGGADGRLCLPVSSLRSNRDSTAWRLAKHQGEQPYDAGLGRVLSRLDAKAAVDQEGLRVDSVVIALDNGAGPIDCQPA